ncbi:MAG: c-type cytochrome [Rhodospirillales bacterium]|nr:c-type cytochrome [Rhodospirillales bacterium]
MIQRRKRRPLWPVIIASVLLVAIAVVYGGGAIFGVGPNLSRSEWPTQFQSNGERIYFTSQSASGLPISFRSGGMHMAMRAGGCVACHGVDRQGGRLMPRFWLAAPPLTPAALFGGQDGNGQDGHGDHAEYNAETLRRAITEGVDPGGKSLNPEMPRWSMAEQDLTDLIGFLRTPVRALHPSPR